MADVRVVIMGPITRTTTTGPVGQFSFESLPPGEYKLDATLPDGRIAGEKHPRSATLDESRPCAQMDLLAPIGASISGIVMYEDGTTAAGVAVELIAADASQTARGFPGFGAETNEHGEYSLWHVPPGHYLVGVRLVGGPWRDEPFAPAYGRTDLGDIVIAVGDDDGEIFISPIVTRRLLPMRIEGAVHWSDGTPAPGLVVTAATRGERGAVRGQVRAQSATDGSFTLDVFADAQYRVNISRGERIVHSMDVTVTDEPLLIALPIREGALQ